MTKTPRTIIVPGVFCIYVNRLEMLRLRSAFSCDSSLAVWQGSVHIEPELRDLLRLRLCTSSDGISWWRPIDAPFAPPILPLLLGRFRREFSNPVRQSFFDCDALPAVPLLPGLVASPLWNIRQALSMSAVAAPRAKRPFASPCAVWPASSFSGGVLPAVPFPPG